LTLSTTPTILSQPALSTLIGTTTCTALPSRAGIGPMTVPVTPAIPPIAVTSRATFARSAGVMPEERS